MFVELKKPFLGRAAGERIDVSRGRRPPARPAGRGRRRRRRPHRPAVARALDAALARARDRASTRPSTSPSRPSPTPSSLRPQARRAGHLRPGGDGDPQGRPSATGAWPWPAATAHYLEKHYGSRFNEWPAKAALAEASGVTGGYTVPPEFYQQLMTDHGARRPSSARAPSSCRWRRPPCRSRISTSPPCSRPACRRSSAACRCTGPPRPRPRTGDGAAVQADGAEGLGTVRLLRVAATCCCRTA